VSRPATVAAAVVRSLDARGARVALAESMTGGGVMHALSAVPGASAVLWGGAVVYTETAKEVLAGVSSVEVERDGPVSASVTAALAEGIRTRAAVEYGAAVTGWAGPTHGAEPVGTTYLAVQGPDGRRAYQAVYDGDRDAVRAQAVAGLLALLLEVVTVEREA